MIFWNKKSIVFSRFPDAWEGGLILEISLIEQENGRMYFNTVTLSKTAMEIFSVLHSSLMNILVCIVQTISYSEIIFNFKKGFIPYLLQLPVHHSFTDKPGYCTQRIRFRVVSRSL